MYLEVDRDKSTSTGDQILAPSVVLTTMTHQCISTLMFLVIREGPSTLSPMHTEQSQAHLVICSVKLSPCIKKISSHHPQVDRRTSRAHLTGFY